MASVPDRAEWKLTGQMLSLTLPITDLVSCVCVCVGGACTRMCMPTFIARFDVDIFGGRCQLSKAN